MNPETGEVAGAITPGEARQLYSQGYRIKQERQVSSLVLDKYKYYAEDRKTCQCLGCQGLSARPRHGGKRDQPA